MNCQEVRSLLSAYLDDELPSDSRSQVSTHVKSCPRCAGELASFRDLSRAAGDLVHPDPPVTIWKNVATQLDAESESVSINRPTEAARGVVFRSASIAAVLLIAVTLAFFGYQNWHGQGHDELTADFSEYLDAFQRDPNDAHLVLVNKYTGKPVQLDQAHLQLGYRPTLAEGLPDGYTIQTSFVMDMPCCRCIKTVCQRADGGTVAIFEHDDEQPIWFGGRPSIQTACGGTSCMLTQMGTNHVAVSWKQGSRHLTVVGAQDVEEAAALVEHLGISAAGEP